VGLHTFLLLLLLRIVSILQAILQSTVRSVDSRLKQYRVISVRLDMFLEVLGPLEGFATEFASMRLQGNVDTDMRSDMVAFHNGDTATTPRTGEVQIIGTLASDMAFADMVLFDDPGD